MITVFPKSSIRYESLGGGKMRCSLPFDLNESAALYAMYVDMCKGCTRAGLLPPMPEEWADILAEHVALNRTPRRPGFTPAAYHRLT